MTLFAKAGWSLTKHQTKLDVISGYALKACCWQNAALIMEHGDDR